jgi:alkanesulfonate monooxygenase SsuD/methylene tetrahydromethanopterin reductase-like flavin-dependent oxidoreductase (luciferase family)
MLAAKANAVDEISGGRLILGLGAGWNEAEYRAFGFPFDQRVSRFEEAFTIVRTLLRDGYVDFGGRFFEVRELPLLPPPHRPGGPPLMVGSIGPRMLSITLPHVAAWNAWGPWFGNSAVGYGPVREQVDAACRAVGRDPAEVGRTVALVIAMPGALGRGSAVTDEAFEPVSGQPELLVRTLTTFAQLGVGHVQLVLDPITVESITALAPTLAVLDG